MLDEKESSLFDFMLDVVDDFYAATFNLLHGFFRQAFFSLRGAIELMTIGSYMQLSVLSNITEWRNNEKAFSKACDGFGMIAPIGNLEQYLQNNIRDTLFKQKNSAPDYPGGWVRRLFGELSNYSHSRPGYANGDIWESNGPVYSLGGIKIFERKYYETALTCLILLKTVRPSLVVSNDCKFLFDKKFSSEKILNFTMDYLF